MIARIYARPNGTLAHVWDEDYGTPETNTVLVSRFLIDDYPIIYQQIADNVKAILYTGGSLLQGETIIIDSAWITARQAELDNAATIETAQAGLLDKIALAEQYADSIKTLYNAVLDQTENQTVQPTRFNTLFAVVQNAPLAFRNRFITDCQEELGFNVAGTLSAAQQRQATLYARVWITGLALLLMARKVLDG